MRHCPRCRSDYRPEMSQCAECEGPLEDRFEETDARFLPPTAPVPFAAVELPPGDYRPVYMSFSVADLQPLAEQLQRQGIPFRVDTTQETREARLPRTRFDLSVRDEERGPAQEALERLHAWDPPEGSSLQETEFDPHTGYSRCPACSAALPHAADRCPDCDLVLRAEPEELVCSACGAAVASSEARCADCGSAFT